MACHNILSAKKGEGLHSKYDGSSATPIFTGNHAVILPAFKYGGESFKPMFFGSEPGIMAKLGFKIFKKQ